MRLAVRGSQRTLRLLFENAGSGPSKLAGHRVLSRIKQFPLPCLHERQPVTVREEF